MKDNIKSALSSVGRAEGPEEKKAVVQPSVNSPVGIRNCPGKDEGSGVMICDPSDETARKLDDSLDETLRVGGSSPSARTKFLPATFTPRWLADDMTALARIRMSSKILEPSAGFGAIVDAIHRWPHGEVHAIELNEENCRELRDRNCTSVYRADFLRVPAPETRTFDRVIMNPPRQFSVEHVIHASLFLAPGGRLVALLRYDAAEIIKNHNPDVRLYSLPRETFLEPGKEGGFVPSCILVADVK